MSESAVYYTIMASSPRERTRQETLQLETGDLVDDFERSAQERSSRHGVTTNLTALGASLHGIEQSTTLTVMVFEEGIWITPKDD